MVAFLEAPKLGGPRGSPGSAQRWGPGAEEQVCTTARTSRGLCTHSLSAWREKKSRMGRVPGSLGWNSGE